jgi:hypothetical protein
VPIARVTYNRTGHSVTIRLAKPTKGNIRVIVRRGIKAANGAVSSSDYTGFVS